MIYIDTESDDYRFYKTLNEDVQLKPNEWNQWDIQMENGDYKNISGRESLHNAICIAIMTRYQELSESPIHNEFGCRIHELIKANTSQMILYEMELFIQEVLENMRRVQDINWITVSEKDTSKFQITFSVSCINDEIVEGSMIL